MSGDHESLNETTAQTEEEDSRLRNWSKWQEEWSRVQGKIAEKLDLQTGDLLMNYSEGISNVKQEKEALEYTKITTEFDKYRGKPDFWKLPNALPRKFKCCNNEPTYFAVKTKEEGYEIPTIHNVGVAESIRYEKNVLNGARNIYKKWQESKYREEQWAKMAEKIENIFPHWPNYEHLAVVGTKIQVHNAEEPLNVSEAEEEAAAEEAKEVRKSDVSIKDNSLSKLASRLSLTINGILLNSNCEDQDTRKLRLFFEYDISASNIDVQYLNFQNQGLATLRISWKKLEKFRLFRNYTDERWEKHGFYFDKKELVILPGHTVELPVWFKTENSGNFTESWEIMTSPQIWGESFHVILILHSYAYFKDLKEKVNKIVEYIDIQARNNLIKDILYDLVNQVRYVETPIVPCVYGEAQLFEIANLVNGLPLISFDEKFVNEMKQIYEKVKIQSGRWNYSINQLKKLVHVKDTNMYLENKLTVLTEKILRIESAKIEPTELKAKSPSKTGKGKKKKGKSSAKSSEKSKKSGSDKAKKSKSKKGKGKSSSKTSQHSTTQLEVRPEIPKEPYEYSNQLDLWNVLKQCYSPVIINSEREKYFLCSRIMVAYFNKMCHLLDFLDKTEGVGLVTTYPPTNNKLVPINKQPERLIYEYFEHHYIPSHQNEIYPFEAKRKPKILRDVPSDDIELLYRTYFNKSMLFKKQASKTKKIGKKGKEKKSKKDAKEKSSTSSKGKKGESAKTKAEKSKKSKKGPKASSQIKLVKKEVSVESFNPYLEQFTYIPETEEPEVMSARQGPGKMSKQEMEDHKYKQYIVVYSCLSGAIDAMVDTLESFDCVVSYPTLNEVKGQISNSDEEGGNENV